MKERLKLFHGALLDHPYFGKLWISHDVRPHGQDHWEAWNEAGKRATPGAFTERGLHFQLRRFVVTQPYRILNREPAPAPPAVQTAYTAYRDFWQESMPDWQPAPQRTLCRHTWQTTNIEERPGFRKFTQTCPSCGKVRVLDRRILEPLPKKPMTVRPPKSTCRHIWIGTGQQVSADGTLTQYTHECPHCKRVKTTTRRTLPKLRTEKAQEVVAALLDS